jgi:uridine kinase
MSAMRKIAAVVGSSGIGKSKLAVELCKALTGQVINADALQVNDQRKKCAILAFFLTKYLFMTGV